MQALDRSGAEADYPFRILRSVMEVNQLQRERFLQKVKTYFGGDLKGKTLAVWGLAFKPETDDIREAPALYIIRELLDAGATIRTFDPEAMDNVQQVFGDAITYATDHYDALKGADALLILTEWAVFRSPDFDRMAGLMRESDLRWPKCLCPRLHRRNRLLLQQHRQEADTAMKTVLITGAAGFLGSHLCDRFMTEGFRVIGMDNLITGDLKNIEHLFASERFTFYHHDVSRFVHVPDELDYILHFASPASPIDYLKIPIQTLKVGSLGTHNLLGLAKAKKARILVASTSEVYGDPQVHPQNEDYWGNVNPIGPRGCTMKPSVSRRPLPWHTIATMDWRPV